MSIKFGPAGLGPIADAVKNLEEYNKKGFQACEIAFTHGPYIKKDEDAKIIKDASIKNKISLSIHAPYWINLNSQDKKKLEMSKQRIIKCCEIGEKLGVYCIVFHSGFYMGSDLDTTYTKIKNSINELLLTIKKNKWNIKLAPETMGKVNVFGSVEQIAQLSKETGCEFCIDFAHILARDKKVDYKKIISLFPQKRWHVHFSGIAYGEKGEKHHKKTESDEWKTLLNNVPKDKEIVIINESPSMIEDSVEGLDIYNKMNKSSLINN